VLEPLTQWRCDYCRQPVTSDAAYVVWRNDADKLERDFKIIHQGRCDPGDRDEHGYPFSMELSHYLGDSGLSRLLSFISNGRMHRSSPPSVGDLDEFIDFVRRLQTPYYEEARTRFAEPEVLAMARELSPDQFNDPDTLHEIVSK
jgi:hypothetical protein